MILIRTPASEQFEYLEPPEQFEFFLFPRFPDMSDVVETTLIPRSLSSIRHPTPDYFWMFHRENINGCYYYSYYDYGQLFTRGLFAIAEESNALYFGLVAFSALIYSLRIDSTVRHTAFRFYALTVQELRLLLDKPMDQKECLIATACAMQLSSFDVVHF